MSKRLFGTDGVRGIANRSLDSILAYKLGQATALLIAKGKPGAKIIIGKDTRISGDMLESALAAGICSAGANAVLVGVAPTPAVAYLTRQQKADAGVVISASHNPAVYNGIKIFNSEGYKLADTIEDEIEVMIKGESPSLPNGDEVGSISHEEDLLELYVDYLVSTCDTRFDGYKVVLDAANGAAYQVSKKVFDALGAETFLFHNAPNGVNINADCGSTHPAFLQEQVSALGADIGLAFDGDADRLIAVDHNGNIVDGDRVLAICAKAQKAEGALAQNAVVATIMSNLGLELHLKEHGISVIKTDVGDRYVLEEMQKNGQNFGGEQSGHVIFLDYNTTGDGVLTGVQLLRVVKKAKQALADLAKEVHILPQVLINAKVSEEKKYQYTNDEQIVNAIASLEATMSGKGRVLIRTSGTEALVRVMIEGEDYAFIEAEAGKLAALIEQRLN